MQITAKLKLRMLDLKGFHSLMVIQNIFLLFLPRPALVFTRFGESAKFMYIFSRGDTCFCLVALARVIRAGILKNIFLQEVYRHLISPALLSLQAFLTPSGKMSLTKMLAADLCP